MSRKLHAVVFASALALTAFSSPTAMARGVVIDPDGVTVWEQIVDWFTGNGDEADGGSSLDPWG